AGGWAAALRRQPVRRLRLIELTVLGCLLTPWLSLLSGLPQWSLGVLSGPESPAVTAAPDNRAGEHGFEDRERLDRAVLAARAEQSTEEKADAVAPAPLPSEPVP